MTHRLSTQTGYAERLAKVPAEQQPWWLIGAIEGTLGRERLSDAEQLAEIRTLLAAFEQGRQR